MWDLNLSRAFHQYHAQRVTHAKAVHQTRPYHTVAKDRDVPVESPSTRPSASSVHPTRARTGSPAPSRPTFRTRFCAAIRSVPVRLAVSVVER